MAKSLIHRMMAGSHTDQSDEVDHVLQKMVEYRSAAQQNWRLGIALIGDSVDSST